LNIFTDKLRKAQAGELVEFSADGSYKSLKPIYDFDRSAYLSGKGFEGRIEDHLTEGYLREHHPCMTTLPLPLLSKVSGTVCSNFRINTERLRALKEAATSNSLEAGFFISTHDAVASLIWRSLMLARQNCGIISPDATVHLATTVDCRRQLNLPTPYFGNAIYNIKMGLPYASLSAASGLQTASQLLRQQIKDTTADKFRDLLSFIERTDMATPTRISVIEEASTTTMMLITWFCLGTHSLDFGEAFGHQIEAFGLPDNGVTPGMPVVLPRLPDGSCEFVLRERRDVMDFVAKTLVENGCTQLS